MAPKKPAETQEFGLRIGRRVVLRPVHVQDYPSLYAIAMAGENATRWRYRGATPSPEQFVRQMWDGVLVQYAVVGRQLGRLYGTVGLYNANLPSGYVYGYAMSAPDRMGSGKVVEGLLLMLEYAFRTWSSARSTSSFRSSISRSFNLQLEGTLLRKGVSSITNFLAVDDGIWLHWHSTQMSGTGLANGWPAE